MEGVQMLNCSRCKQQKHEEEFSRGTLRGYQRYCKQCAREYLALRDGRAIPTGPFKHRRKYSNEAERRRSHSEQTIAHRKRKADHYREYGRKYRELNRDRINALRKMRPRKNRTKRYDPIKARARGLLNYAVRCGRVKRAPCAICADPRSQAHHGDYSKPYEVIWLCARHHYQVEKGLLPYATEGVGI